MSSQGNWDDRPRSRGCTWVYEIVGKLKCPKADTRERQLRVDSGRHTLGTELMPELDSK